MFSSFAVFLLCMILIIKIIGKAYTAGTHAKNSEVIYAVNVRSISSI